MQKETTFIYSDPLNDDFAGISRKKKNIGPDYLYINNNFFWKIIAFIVYRLIMTPIAYFHSIFFDHVKIVNKKIMKGFSNKGYFIYGNHTLLPGDAFIPNMITFPKKAYFIVHEDNVALKGTENFMKMIGAMPIPSTMEGTRNFVSALEKRVVEHNAIVVFPEAHIWPYYNDIRPFKSVSFKYPVKFNDPSFCFTTCFKKRKFGKKPKVVVFLDGPFYPNVELPYKDSQEDLRNRVYETMKERVKYSDYEYIKYVKKDEE